jgi:hypothetical protein
MDTSSASPCSREELGGVRYRITTIVLAILVVTTVPSCTIIDNCRDPQLIPEAVHSPPAYPGARRLTAKVVPPGTGPGYRSTTFYTPDSPEQVYAFYKNALLNEGWAMQDPPPPIDGISIVWHDGCKTHNGWGFVITATARDATQVEVQFFEDPPWGFTDNHTSAM